jgi:hypothetical protein
MTDAAKVPTRKWIATQVTALTGFLTAWIVVGSWNQQLSLAAVTLLGQAIVGYLVPNLPTPPADRDAPAPAARTEAVR